MKNFLRLSTVQFLSITRSIHTLQRKSPHSMEQTGTSTLAKLTESEARFAVACETLNAQMAKLSSGKAPHMDDTLCALVFEELYYAVLNCFRSFNDPWPEVTLKYIALYDENSYSWVTGVRLNKVRELFVVKLSTKLSFNSYHRNWKWLMCCAAQGLLLTRDMSNEEREHAIREAVLIRHRMSDRRNVVRQEELSA